MWERMSGADLEAQGIALWKLEESLATSPDRLTDLSQADGSLMSFMTVEDYAAKRRVAPLKNHVKSAIVTATQLQYGLARMFQTLNDNPMIEIKLFDDRAKAIEWLKNGTAARRNKVMAEVALLDSPTP